MGPVTALVSAIYGGYDQPHPLPDGHGFADAVLVTDQRVEVDGWRVVVEDRPGLHPRMAAKAAKCMPWRYTDEPASLWLDGAFEVAPGLAAIVDEHLADADLVAWRHPSGRLDAAQEAEFSASADAFCSGVSLVGNEIWAGTSAIYANTSPWGQWLNGFTISGNVLMVNAGSGKVVMGLDSAKNGIITGNSFNIAGSGVGTGVNLGADTSSINLQSNSYGPALQPCSNFGAGNLVGGGSA